jgi:hypothetical protein
LPRSPVALIAASNSRIVWSSVSCSIASLTVSLRGLASTYRVDQIADDPFGMSHRTKIGA